MPIFEFRCEKCGNVFETVLKDADSSGSCPKCGSALLKKLLSSCAIIFKGSGFYATDYKNRAAKEKK